MHTTTGSRAPAHTPTAEMMVCTAITRAPSPYPTPPHLHGTEQHAVLNAYRIATATKNTDSRSSTHTLNTRRGWLPHRTAEEHQLWTGTHILYGATPTRCYAASTTIHSLCTRHAMHPPLLPPDRASICMQRLQAVVR